MSNYTVYLHDLDIAIIRLLIKNPLSVKEISNELKIPLKTTSKFVNKLNEWGVIKQKGYENRALGRSYKIYESASETMFIITKDEIKIGLVK
jgi:predicted transcriptional regulator